VPGNSERLDEKSRYPGHDKTTETGSRQHIGASSATNYQQKDNKGCDHAERSHISSPAPFE
jgi:hypothetical protein